VGVGLVLAARIGVGVGTGEGAGVGIGVGTGVCTGVCVGVGVESSFSVGCSGGILFSPRASSSVDPTVELFLRPGCACTIATEETITSTSIATNSSVAILPILRIL
jgi:hypothetical protein